MSEETSIDGLLESYRSAVGAKDVDAFVALYDPAVRVFDTWGRWSYDDLDAWRANVAEWFGSLGDERVGASFDEVCAVTDNDVGVVHAYVTYRGLAADGRELRAMQNRLTWALRRRDGVWRIAHEHTSAPADSESGKVMLQR